MALIPGLKIGKREALARAFSVTPFFHLTKVLSASRLTIFGYHRIARGDPAREPFDSAVFGPNEEDFRQELLTMKRNADAISESDLIDCLNHGRKLPKRSFIISFDDGYRDNHDRALPILKELSIPAVFFIPTQPIEERKLGWWDHVSWYLKQTTKDSFTVRGTTYRRGDSVAEAATRFLQMIKLDAATGAETLLRELGEASGVAEPSRELCDAELMTWEQIRALDRAGMTIGSHTHSHRVLARLDLATQKEELVRSKKILEERLGKPVRSISYPVGGYEHFNVETKSLAREAGYEIAYSYLTGVNHADAIDRYDVKRMCPDPYPGMFDGIFLLPRIFAIQSCALPEPRPCAQK